jgi:hypothetical protein
MRILNYGNDYKSRDELASKPKTHVSEKQKPKAKGEGKAEEKAEEKDPKAKA